MLVFIGHAPNTISNCAAFVQQACDMAPICSVGGSNIDYSRNGTAMIMTQHHMMTTGQFPSPIVDVSSKVGVPLKRTSGSTTPKRCPPNTTTETTKYKTVLCDKFAAGHCPYGDKCLYAHGHDEIRSRPRHPKWKTELCRNFHLNAFCNYGERCDFIHGERNPEAFLAAAAAAAAPNRNQQQQLQQQLESSTNQWSLTPAESATGRHIIGPFTIPTSAVMIGGGGGSAAPDPYNHHHGAQSLSGLGSVSSGSISCTDSPPPLSSSYERSPISYSPDLMMTNNSNSSGLSPSIDRYNQCPNPWSVQQQQQRQALIQSNTTTTFANLPSPRSETSNTASVAGRTSTFSTDSITSDYWPQSRVIQNPHPPNDLDQLCINLRRLGVCRRRSSDWNNDDVFAENVPPPYDEYEPITDQDTTWNSVPIAVAEPIGLTSDRIPGW